MLGGGFGDFFLISLQVPMSIEVSALFNCKSPGKYLIFGC